MAFWAAIAVGVTCVLHVLLILLCRVYNRHPPPLLEFPRLELLMFLLITQPVGQLAGRGRLDVNSPLLFITPLFSPILLSAQFCLPHLCLHFPAVALLSYLSLPAGESVPLHKRPSGPAAACAPPTVRRM